MTQDRAISDSVDRLKALLEDKLGLRRGDLAQRAAKAGRRLPVAVRRDLEAVSRAVFALQVPRLARQTDREDVLAAAQRAEAHLKGIDARDQRRGRLLGMLGALVFNLLLLFVLVLAVLRWRGLI